PEPFVILDDAIVDDRDPAGAIEMRMRILVGRLTVGRPAGVADAGVAGCWLGFQGAGKGLVNPPFFLSQLQFAVRNNRETRAIIAAVLQSPERLDDDWGGGPF